MNERDRRLVELARELERRLRRDWPSSAGRASMKSSTSSGRRWKSFDEADPRGVDRGLPLAPGGVLLGLMAAVLTAEWLCDQARATDDRIRWLTAVGGSPTVRHATRCTKPLAA
jgi:hypothetical protein